MVLDPDPLRLLGEAAIVGHPRAPFGAYLFAASEPAAAIGGAVEREIFLESFANDAEELALEYGP